LHICNTVVSPHYIYFKPCYFKMQVFKDETSVLTGKMLQTLLDLLDPEDGGGMFFCNYSKLVTSGHCITSKKT
jgi:hypothetical protein